MTLCTFCQHLLVLLLELLFYACRGQRPEFLSANGSATNETE